MRAWKIGLIALSLSTLTFVCVVGVLAGIHFFGDTSGRANGASESLAPSGTAQDGAAPRSSSLTPTTVAGAATNRIALVGDDGNIWTVAADGSDLVAVTEDAELPDLVYRYPTWSPIGNKLAFVELQLSEGIARGSALHLYDVDAGAAVRIPTEYPPFYLYWSPTGETLAFLSNWSPEPLALRTVDVAGEADEAVTLSLGSPFYFSWHPDGERMLAHIGLDELTFLDQSGERQPLNLEAGQFQAPHWSANGEYLAFVGAGEEGENVLIISDANGANGEEVSKRQGLYTFNWSPDSQRLAYSNTRVSVGLAAFGPLWLYDRVSKAQELVSVDPVIAYFWSPDGRKLAYLRPELTDPDERDPQAAPLQQESALWFRWYIWDGEKSYPLARFSPNESFVVDYLRYFDQYAQSISLWSADSTMLLYTGTSEEGLEGVWALPVEEGSEPRRVTQGQQATWSRQ